MQPDLIGPADALPRLEMLIGRLRYALQSDERAHASSDVAVVIPTENNELVIGSLVLLASLYANRVIVVDDSSHDRTVEVAKHAGAEVIPVDSYGGRGRTLSILVGCTRACENGCTAIVLLDNQGRYLTSEIPRLVEPILAGEADLVIGSRNLHGRRGIPPYGHSDLSDSQKPREFHSTDPSSTFRAIRCSTVDLLDLLPDSDEFESAMITLFSRKGRSLKEIPISIRHEIPVRDDEDLPLFRGRRIGVVVPAHNEELLLGDTLAGIPDFVARVYVVNDCSTDRTHDVMEHYAGLDPSVVPIHHEENRGVGGAVVTGYRRALEDGMDIVAVMAGDNQMDPAFLPELLDPIVLGKCDYTMGNRLVNPEYRKSMSRWRFFGNALLTLLTKIASGYWQMVDPQNGYTAISRRALEQIDLLSIFPWYGYCNDLLVKLNVWGFKVVNVPHPARYGKEKSGIRYSSYMVRLSQLLLADFLWRLKMKYVLLSFHPLVFYYIMGAVLIPLGVLGGLYSLYYKFFAGQPIFVPAVVSLLVFALGTQFLLFAMFFDMRQESEDGGWY